MDGRADQYALAATTYQLLTGVQLFPHSNPAVVISRHLNAPPPLGDRRPDCAGLDAVLRIALSKDPSDRFSSCGAFARALADESTRAEAAPAAAITQEAPRQRRPDPATLPAFAPGTPEQQPRRADSRPAWVALAAAAAVMLVIGVAVLAWRWSEGSRQTAAAGTATTTRTSAPTAAPALSPPPPVAPPPAASPAPPASPAPTTTVPTRTPVPGGLLQDAANPCDWCDTSDVKFFKSPSGNISCEIDFRRGHGISDAAYCMSISPPQNVAMNSSGVLTTVCTSGDSCLSNPPYGEPTLPYGHTTELGPFTCLSESSAVTCTVSSGRGFAISKSGITPVG